MVFGLNSSTRKESEQLTNGIKYIHVNDLHVGDLLLFKGTRAQLLRSAAAYLKGRPLDLRALVCRKERCLSLRSSLPLDSLHVCGVRGASIAFSLRNLLTAPMADNTTASGLPRMARTFPHTRTLYMFASVAAVFHRFRECACSTAVHTRLATVALLRTTAYYCRRDP